MTLEERIEKLERYHRRRWFRRAVKISLFIALLLLLLWLIMDALHLGMIVDALQKQVVNNSQLLNEVHSQVTSLQNVTNGLTIKVNGIIQHYVHSNAQSNIQSSIHSSIYNLRPVAISSVAGGITGALLGLLRLLPLAFI